MKARDSFTIVQQKKTVFTLISADLAPKVSLIDWNPLMVILLFQFISRSIISQRSLRDRKRGSSVNGSISGSARNSSDRLQAICENDFSNASPSQTIKNSVQAQIEKMFTDVAKDDPAISSCFAIKYLGALPLVGKVTSLLGLQDPLRQLYLSGAGHGVSETLFFITLSYFYLSRHSSGATLYIIFSHFSGIEKKNLPLIECHIVLIVNYTQVYDVLAIHIKEIERRKKSDQARKTHLQLNETHQFSNQ